jgi:hypothetical protein
LEALAISDDTFVRFDPSQFDSSIHELGVQKRFFEDGKVWLTKYGDIKHIVDPADLETVLYRRELWSETAGKFQQGATLRAVGELKGAVPAGVTNKTNGVRQWYIQEDIQPQNLDVVLQLKPPR